ncbi:hypothetical protein [Candidatus Leptofilum sp.]|uniref:hypothetical protein n=1 Tax=Candidatus Leptofilum sp. TaxID=3241576 RepID=UPI003B5BA542
MRLQIFLLLAAIAFLFGCDVEQQSIADPETTPTVALQTNSIKIDREYLPPAMNEETGAVDDYLMVPHLIAPAELYEDQPTDTSITGVAGFPVARLANTQTADVQRMAIFVAESGAFTDEDAVGFGILSSIRYTFGDGRTLYISTTHLSPAAMEQTISFSGSVVMLPTQGEAWLDMGLGLPTTPRSLNFVKDGFIITVTGDVNREELISVADQLVLE